MNDDDTNFVDDEVIFVKYEPTSGFTPIFENSLQDPPTKKSKTTDDCGNQVLIEEPTNIDFPMTELPPVKRKKRHIELDSFEKDIINILKQNQSQLDYSIHDPEAMFFISHVPLIKKLPPNVKLDFQVKFLQLLQSYSSPTVQMAMEHTTLTAPVEYSVIEETSNDGVQY